jgi:hypothetical protein
VSVPNRTDVVKVGVKVLTNVESNVYPEPFKGVMVVVSQGSNNVIVKVSDIDCVYGTPYIV